MCSDLRSPLQEVDEGAEAKERIYEDDQMVIFVNETLPRSKFQCMGLKACESQIQHNLSKRMNPLKKRSKKHSLIYLKAER